MNNTLRFIALALLVSVNLNAVTTENVSTLAEINRLAKDLGAGVSSATQSVSENVVAFYRNIAGVPVQKTRMQQVVGFVKNNAQQAVKFAKENKVKTAAGTAVVVVAAYAIYKWSKSGRKSATTREQEEATVEAITA